MKLFQNGAPNRITYTLGMLQEMQQLQFQMVERINKVIQTDGEKIQFSEALLITSIVKPMIQSTER
jgi:hypothetical protein